MLKVYLKGYGYLLGIVLISTLILTILNYFSLFGDGITNILKLIIPIGSIFGTAWFIGKKTSKRGLLEGLKYGAIIVLIMLILNSLILGNGFEVKILIYYLILLISAMFGSMIGINRKKD